MNNQIVYSIIEASYAIYMFNYFETKLTIQHPLKQFENCIVSIGDFLRHPTERSEFVENKICPIGHIVGFLFGFYILLRCYWIVNFKFTAGRKLLNKIIIGLLFLGCLILNWNALVYYMPIFIYEFWMYF